MGLIQNNNHLKLLWCKVLTCSWESLTPSIKVSASKCIVVPNIVWNNFPMASNDRRHGLVLISIPKMPNLPGTKPIWSVAMSLDTDIPSRWAIQAHYGGVPSRSRFFDKLSGMVTRQPQPVIRYLKGWIVTRTVQQLLITRRSPPLPTSTSSSLNKSILLLLSLTARSKLGGTWELA